MAKKEAIFDDDIKAVNKEEMEKLEAERRKTVADFIATFSTVSGGNILLKFVYDLYLFRPYKQQNAGAYAKEGKREYILELISAMGEGVFLDLYSKAIKQEAVRQGQIKEQEEIDE